jgi:hypothetical protein
MSVIPLIHGAKRMLRDHLTAQQKLIELFLRV